MGTTIGEVFFRGGWVMWPLLVFSVLTWAVIFERAFVFLTVRPKIRRLSETLLKALKSGDGDSARHLCHGQKPFISDVFLAAIDSRKGREGAERVTERNRVRLMTHLKKNLWVLGTIGSASPFVGLLGTVLGIVRAFHDMSEKGAGGFTVVAGGISEALVATAAGLVVAIVALLTYNVFVTAANQTLGSLKFSLEELLDQTFSKSAA